MSKEFIRIVTEDTVEMITDDTLREMKSHGTADFPFQYYSETFDWKRLESIEWHWHNEIELIYVCDGKIKWFADSYDVFNKDGDKIAYVKFNMWDTKGTMVDMDGNVIAKYNSAWSRYDYIVSIYDNCPIDDESILMIFASYVSDVRSDSRN